MAKTNLRLCQKKVGDCLQCDGLHLCRYFVCGGCTFGPKCKKCHDLTTPCNAEILKRFGLHDLTEKELFQLLLQNDPDLLPEICPHYNRGLGAFGSCKFTTSCTKLHVCLHNLQGDCKFGSSCKRAHSIDEHGKKLFRGFSEENMQNLNVIYRNKLGQPERPATSVPVLLPMVTSSTLQPSISNPGPLTSPAGPSKPTSDADRDEICLYSIRRQCKFKDKCVRVHWHLPYRWQVLERDGTWKNLVNTDDIEKAYCDPAYDTSCMDQPSTASLLQRLLLFQSSAPTAPEAVDFMTMTCGGSPVRRLSTASSVSNPPHYILTTEWVWYWKDDIGKWTEFGHGDFNTPASVTSETLENMYLADRHAAIPFTAGKQQYVLYFKDAAGSPEMYQQNVKFKTRRKVRRRPRFVSAQDVEVKLKSPSSHGSSASAAESFPSHWDKNALPELGYKLVRLSNSATDYNMIEKLFMRTMPQGKINSIQRIQNPSLWKVFQWQKEQMKGRNGGKPVIELYLFHGTDESLVEAICEQNFDWRMSGVNGTAFGKGSYFARDASYSEGYCKFKARTNKFMFVALVLVGEYTRGSGSYVRPPARKNSKALYDSCVNSESDPSIYVIFEKLQIYPEYLVNFS
ncbi:LOW QUALITY PROTEIN: protein mono-ADP-ribosyltransferase PARP12 [Brachyistius frenatus]|uniref:LOW QUALITY PROTEIN: protein mono-ADP-ribosyltransferase PARP12 n=1 Tax=Brachyistius frenatus TaxID=100188 RepID=UPI0037E71FF7